jgi:hypothetical protein
MGLAEVTARVVGSHMVSIPGAITSFMHPRIPLALLSSFALLACGQAFSEGGRQDAVAAEAGAADALPDRPVGDAGAGEDAPQAACIAAGAECSTEFPCCGSYECGYVPGPSGTECHSPLCCYSSTQVYGPFPCDTTQDPNGSPTPGGFRVQCDTTSNACSMVGIQSQVLAGTGVVMPCSAPEVGTAPPCAPFDGGAFRGALGCCGQGICICSGAGCGDEGPACDCPNGCQKDPSTGAVGCE